MRNKDSKSGKDHSQKTDTIKSVRMYKDDPKLGKGKEGAWVGNRIKGLLEKKNNFLGIVNMIPIKG